MFFFGLSYSGPNLHSGNSSEVLMGVPELQLVLKPQHFQGLGQAAWPRLGTCFPWLVLVPSALAAPRGTHGSGAGWHPRSTEGD